MRAMPPVLSKTLVILAAAAGTKKVSWPCQNVTALAKRRATALLQIADSVLCHSRAGGLSTARRTSGSGSRHISALLRRHFVKTCTRCSVEAS